MRRINFRNPRARAALVAAMATLIGGGLGGVALAQSRQPDAPYRSSIQVPDNGKEEGDREEADDQKGEKGEQNEKAEQNEQGEADEAKGAAEAGNPAERAEAAGYRQLARITADQARTAASARVPGTVTSVDLENEDGNLVYGVSIMTAAGARDVKVDAGNGAVLHVEQD